MQKDGKVNFLLLLKVFSSQLLSIRITEEQIIIIKE